MYSSPSSPLKVKPSGDSEEQLDLMKYLVYSYMTCSDKEFNEKLFKETFVSSSPATRDSITFYVHSTKSGAKNEWLWGVPISVGCVALLSTYFMYKDEYPDIYSGIYCMPELISGLFLMIYVPSHIILLSGDTAYRPELIARLNHVEGVIKQSNAQIKLKD